MFMRPYASNSHAPRKTYRDIADGFDRMGNVMMPGAVAAYASGEFPYPGPGPGYPEWLAAGCPPPGCCPVPPPTSSRIGFAGFQKVCIPAGDCETVETTICAQFMLTALYISPKISSCLSISRFRVGCQDLFLNCDPVPADVFSCCELDENQFGSRQHEANSPICLTVDNECEEEDVCFWGAVKLVVCESC